MDFILDYKTNLKIINLLKFILQKSPKQVSFYIHFKGIGSSSCVTVVVIASLLSIFGFIHDFSNDEEFYLINMLSQHSNNLA